jgi:hypothetical protein
MLNSFVVCLHLLAHVSQFLTIRAPTKRSRANESAPLKHAPVTSTAEKTWKGRKINSALCFDIRGLISSVLSCEYRRPTTHPDRNE